MLETGLGRYNRQFFNEPKQLEWKAYAYLLRESGLDPDHYSLNVQQLYQELCLMFAACGFPRLSRLEHKKHALIIGAETGLVVRMANDMGIKTVGVETRENLVALGRRHRIVEPYQLYAISPMLYMSAISDNHLPKPDVIIAPTTPSSNLEELEDMYELAYYVLKPGGTLLLATEQPLITTSNLPDYFIDSPDIGLKGRYFLRAKKT